MNKETMRNRENNVLLSGEVSPDDRDTVFVIPRKQRVVERRAEATVARRFSVAVSTICDPFAEREQLSIFTIDGVSGFFCSMFAAKVYVYFFM